MFLNRHFRGTNIDLCERGKEKCLIHAEGLNLREACESKYVPKSGKGPKGGGNQL